MTRHTPFARDQSSDVRRRIHKRTSPRVKPNSAQALIRIYDPPSVPTAMVGAAQYVVQDLLDDDGRKCAIKKAERDLFHSRKFPIASLRAVLGMAQLMLLVAASVGDDDDEARVKQNAKGGYVSATVPVVVHGQNDDQEAVVEKEKITDPGRTFFPRFEIAVLSRKISRGELLDRKGIDPHTKKAIQDMDDLPEAYRIGGTELWRLVRVRARDLDATDAEVNKDEEERETSAEKEKMIEVYFVVPDRAFGGCF